MSEKLIKICQYEWKIVEMDENVIDEMYESTVLMNPQYMLYSV